MKRIESMGYATYDPGGVSNSEVVGQCSLFAWEKEQKVEEDKAAKVARTMLLLYTMERMWSAERLLTPVTMDTIMQLRRLLYPPDGIVPK